MALDFITGGEELATKILGFFKTPEDALNGTKALYDFQAKVQEVEASKYMAEIDLLKAQSATNTAEAASSNLFVAGWRPFCGWASGITVFGGVWFGLVMLFMGKPEIPTAIAMLIGIPVSVLMGMLGLHSLDRYNGVSAEQDPADPTPKQKANQPPKR
jgi:hypothetical protein